MPRQKQTYLFIFLLAATLTLATFSYNRSGMSLAQQTLQERDAKLPIADYDAPESNDKEKREKRRKKGRKYNDAIYTGESFGGVDNEYISQVGTIGVSGRFIIVRTRL